MLVGPGESTVASRLSERLMRPSSAMTNSHQLIISIDRPPEEQLDTLQRLQSDAVETQVLIDARSYAGSDTRDKYGDQVDVLRVSKPSDLRRIGILTTKVLTRWDNAGVPISVCFQSISNLLDAVTDTQRVFRFLHILHGRIRAADAHAYFYFDSTRHDEQTTRTFYSLFDSVLEFDADGSLAVL
uniref:DUF7504 family protein n=1 Tax=Haloferax profundi TaxID=1544718 RepID=UPI0018D21C6A|nr:hypothetical protein [Haloferax profundi]